MTDTEKVTINMSVVDLGQIDLLVEEGYFSSRTDFIRSAIRVYLSQHSEAVKQTVTRRTMVVGSVSYSRADLERYRARGEILDVRVVGVFYLPNDVDAELAQSVFKSIKVVGVFRASNLVKQALADRMQ
jgi:Arc/MetJ-type ribon-helix-helix transcriptional regulator